VNPFASRRVRPESNLYRFAGDAESDQFARANFLSRLFQTLDQLRRAAIVGPHGTGKTTLLRSLEPHLHDKYDHVVVVALSSQRRHAAKELLSKLPKLVSPKANEACLVIDGYEQLRWRDRAAILCAVRCRRSLSLLVTCHHSSVWIPTCFRTRFDPPLTRLLTAEKLADLPEPIREELWSRFEQQLAGSVSSEQNLRELWFAMYDEYEKIRHHEKQPS
jgi:energy-coupling factor transporter ATP-binding protein EcfA2